MYSTFESTYVRESTFYTMKQVKSKNRNRMVDDTVNDSLRLATTNTGIEKGTILSEKPRSQASY